MMLIGHSIAQSVHLMQRSSSRRNIPRNRSEGTFFCSGYWIVTFFLKKWRPVTERPSKRSSKVSLSSHFFSAMDLSLCDARLVRALGHGGEPVSACELLTELREQPHDREETAEDPAEPNEPARRARRRQNRQGDDDNVRQRQRQQPLPPECHQLVEPVSRKRRTKPDVGKDEKAGLDEEPEKRRDQLEERQRADVRKGSQPAAEEHGHRDARDDDHARVLAQEKEGELDSRVLGV